MFYGSRSKRSKFSPHLTRASLRAVPFFFVYLLYKCICFAFFFLPSAYIPVFVLTTYVIKLQGFQWARKRRNVVILKVCGYLNMIYDSYHSHSLLWSVCRREIPQSPLRYLNCSHVFVTSCVVILPGMPRGCCIV